MFPTPVCPSDLHLLLSIVEFATPHHFNNKTVQRLFQLTPQRSALTSSKKPIYFTFHRGRWEKLNNNLACIIRRFFIYIYV